MKIFPSIVMSADSYYGNTGGGFVEGGSTPSNMPASMVSQISDMEDHQKVVLRGQIVEKKGDESYLFKDASDSITLKIPTDRWHGVTVTPADMVEIGGEVDKGILMNAVNVDWIKKH